MGGVRWFGTAALVFLVGCDAGLLERDTPWQLELVSEPGGRVPRSGPLLVAAHRRLSPSSVDRGTVRLGSASVGELIFPGFDPVTEQLVIELARPLLADTSYVLRFEGLQDLDGFVLDGPLQLLVRTADAFGGPPTESAPVDRVLALLRNRCADGGCHDSNVRAAQLVLDSVEGIATTALDRASPQVASPNRLHEPLGEGLVDLAIIDATGGTEGVSRSYLIYKVLADRHVLGEPMPPPNAGPPLSVEETSLLASWIAGGSTLE